MNTHSNLSNALESDFRAIASHSRATEMKRLWKALWKKNTRRSSEAEAHTPAPMYDHSVEVPCAPALLNSERLPKAA